MVKKRIYNLILTLLILGAYSTVSAIDIKWNKP